MSSSLEKRSDLLTAADTFRETFDEESQHPGARRASALSGAPSTDFAVAIDEASTFDPRSARNANNARQTRRGRAGIVFAAMLAVVVVIALGVGLSARGGGGEAGASTASAVPETEVKEVPTGTVTVLSEGALEAPGADVQAEAQAEAKAPTNEEAEAAVEEHQAEHEDKPHNSIFDAQLPSETSADDADGGPQMAQPAEESQPEAEEPATPGVQAESEFESQPEPESSQLVPENFAPELEEEVGDAALVMPVDEALVAAASTGSPGPTASPVAAPTTEAPTTEAPTTEAPTEEPTPEPTPAPTAEPTPAPTAEPTAEPTAKPTAKPIDFSGWANFNWSGETDAPSGSPTPTPTPAPTTSSTDGPTSAPSQSGPFFFGEEFYTNSNLDIHVSTGLTVKPIAWAGRPVPYADGTESKLDYHYASDAAGIVSMNPEDPLNSGYVYVANAELSDKKGGVYGIYFDKDGNVLEYKALLEGTSRNCGGGHTPWNTWISCEEDEGGQCHEVDPVNDRTAETALGGKGGEYESVACDDRDPENLKFFTTEDDSRGALRRFETTEYGWGAIHGGGTHTYLRILDGNTYEWTSDLEEGRDSAEQHFPKSEGIQVHEGKLYFMSKEDQTMLILDLDSNTYTVEKTGKKMYGEGDFGDQPDQNYFGPTRKYMYFTEDGGATPGVHARYGEDGSYFTLFQGIKGGLYDDDETVGIALSPDHKKFYAGFQTYGVIFEVTRDDGLAFE